MENEAPMTSKEAQDLKDMVRRIEVAICGDEAAGITGIIKKVVRHEKQITALQRLVWILTGAVTMLTVIWAVFKEFIQ